MSLASGVQTVRLSGAGPVSNLHCGATLTGCFFELQLVWNSSYVDYWFLYGATSFPSLNVILVFLKRLFGFIFLSPLIKSFPQAISKHSRWNLTRIQFLFRNIILWSKFFHTSAAAEIVCPFLVSQLQSSLFVDLHSTDGVFGNTGGRFISIFRVMLSFKRHFVYHLQTWRPRLSKTERN